MKGETNFWWEANQARAGEENSGSKTGKRKGDNFRNTRSRPGGGKKQVAQCGNCGKNHSGECLKGKFVCYRCGQEGHISPNCPNPRMNRGCFKCGSTEHKVKDCPKKGGDTGSASKGKGSGTLVTTEPTSTNKPTESTARVFNMTVQYTVAVENATPGIIRITSIFRYI